MAVITEMNGFLRFIASFYSGFIEDLKSRRLSLERSAVHILCGACRWLRRNNFKEDGHTKETHSLSSTRFSRVQMKVETVGTKIGVQFEASFSDTLERKSHLTP